MMKRDNSKLMSFLIILLISFNGLCFSKSVVKQWDFFVLELDSHKDYGWWQFPVQAVFRHTDGTEISLNAYWDGEQRWLIKFAPPKAGKWRYITSSADPAMNGIKGKIIAEKPTQNEMEKNPNFRGHLYISENSRYFHYADGTPSLLFGDTNWAINTLRCGLGKNHDGPFYQYLENRKQKKFNCILLAFMRGFGDTRTEPAGQRNEGGYPFNENNVEQLNPSYFHYLDKRMDAIWQSGFVVAAHPTWFAKEKNCFFDSLWAQRISQYLMVRYGAYNILWSLTGEYNYVFRDCGWNDSQVNELGEAVQKYNVYRHPVSIHPSGRTDWDAPHNLQSSRAFAISEWLDHNWLQTGQQDNLLHNIVQRSLENYNLEPPKPVFMAEAYYERLSDSAHVYHTRWQPWNALLNGAAGYGYGAVGIWQFFDPDAEEKGKFRADKFICKWQEALTFEGANQMKYVQDLFEGYPWWKLTPQRELLTVDNTENPLPTSQDISPPHCAAIKGSLYIIYVPRKNDSKSIKIKIEEALNNYNAKWYNPRNGEYKIIGKIQLTDDDTWILPERPGKGIEDWVCIIEAGF